MDTTSISNTSTTSNEGRVIELSEKDINISNIEAFTDEELKYTNQYRINPFAKHIRVAITGYLDKTNTGIDWESVRTGKNEPNCGMEKFSDYFSSKYVVLSMVEGTYGGLILNIVFVDKPDRVFSVWVYDLGNGALGYDMRGFCDRAGSENETKIILKSFSNLINKKSNEL